MKVLITAALPYANGTLHFGHIAGAYLPADVFARFSRLKGDDVLFICGSDEYGVAITISAELAGRSPKEHVDIFHPLNKALFSQMGISFDHYSRTTWEGHKIPVQQFFLDLLEKGYIEERICEQLYSEKDNRFLADRYVVGICPRCKAPEARGDECPHCGAAYEATDLIDPRSKISGGPLTLRKTNHWFLRFDLFKQELKHWLEKKKWKANVLNFATPYIDDLRPRAITRDSTWGIPLPLPGTEGKAFYVWFDAPIGYISATQDWAQNVKKEPEAWKSYWLDPETKLVQFIGKDNIPFHSIFFPAMCLGQKTPYKLVDDLPANEFLHLEGRQFSKSSGWTIDLESFFSRYSSDQIRSYLAAIAPETSDAEFSWKGFQLHCNSELVGKLGNLANRTLVFLAKEGGLTPSRFSLAPIDQQFLAEIKRHVKEAEHAYQNYSLRGASRLIFELATSANVYYDVKKPWQLAKDPAKREEFETTMSLCLECLQALAAIASPILPHAMEKLWKLIGLSGPIALNAQMPEPKSLLPPPEVLFHKVEEEEIEKEQAALNALRQVATKEQKGHSFPPLKPEVGIEDFEKLDLRVAQIVSAEAVPGANKLLKLTLDLGFETRTVVSGIAKQFPIPAHLIGKRVTLIANLKPAIIRGVTSQGMILCASSDGVLEPLFLNDAPAGTPVK